MYCRQCGEKINNVNAVICVKCGTKKGEESNFCPSCGNKIKNKEGNVCLSCGVSLNKSKGVIDKIIHGKENNNNCKAIAGLLAIFLGGTGIHRFYLGYKEIGFIQLGIFIIGLLIFDPVSTITIIWALVDAVMIFTGKLSNVNGTKLV